MKWIPFKQSLYADQKLPPERKFVLVQVRMMSEKDSSKPDHTLLTCACVVGYMKFGAGDKNSPYFVCHSIRGPWEVVAWSDCLPKNFDRNWTSSKESSQ